MREPVNETADPGSTTEDGLGVGALPSFTGEKKKKKTHTVKMQASSGSIITHRCTVVQTHYYKFSVQFTLK